MSFRSTRERVGGETESSDEVAASLVCIDTGKTEKKEESYE